MQARISDLFDDGTFLDLSAGETLFRVGESCTRVHLVLTGGIDLVRYSEDGKVLRLHTAGPGQVVAEASVYSRAYHCDGIASATSRLVSISTASFRAGLEVNLELAHLWAASLARSLQNARMLSEIRAMRTVAERLDAWLSQGRDLPEKGTWQELAEHLGVSREALYREIARRRTLPKT